MRQQMRINIVLPGLALSGGVRVAFEHANRLSERGHEVTIVSPLVPPAPERDLLDLKHRGRQLVKAIDRKIRGETVEWFDVAVPRIHVPTLSPRLINRFATQVPDADVTIATSWETAYAVDSLPRSKGTKVYFVQHYEIWDTWNSERAWEEVAQRSDDTTEYPIEMADIEPVERVTRRQKSFVDRSYSLQLSHVTVSTWLARLLEEKFAASVAGTVPNAIDHETFFYDPNGNRSDLSILVPFRVQAWKGRNESIRLFERLHEAYPEVKLQVYTPRNAAELLPDYVTVYHHPTDAELRRLYSDSDIFVFPSWVEGWGLPPFEAMACRCAVVSSSVGGVPEYADDGRCISLVPPRDGNELFRAVSRLIEDDERRERLQRNGQRRVSELTWDGSTNAFETLLESLVASRVRA